MRPVIRLSAFCVGLLVQLEVFPQTPSLALTEEMARHIQLHIAAARSFDGQFAAAVAAQEAAWQALALSKTALRLRITASGSVFYTDRTEQAPLAENSRELQRDFLVRQAVIAARQPLYRKRDRVSIEQAALRFQEASVRARQAELELTGRVLQAWVEILAARDLMILSQSMLELAEAIVLESQRRHEAGELSIDSVGLEIARLQKHQADWVESVAKLEIAERTLADISGPEASVPLIFSLEAATPNHSSFQSQAEVQALVRSRNHLLHAAKLAFQAAELEVQKAQSEQAPTVEAYMSLTAGENDVASYIKNEHRLGIQVVLPLHASGAFNAATGQAQALARQSEALARALEVQLLSQAWRAFLALQVSLIRLESTRISGEAAQLRVDAVRRRVEAGESSREEIDRAQSDYHAIRQQAVREKLEYAKAWIDLHLLTASGGASQDTPSTPVPPKPEAPLSVDPQENLVKN
jgi:outer membrane protein TolC